jgi:hypothetical protein
MFHILSGLMYAPVHQPDCAKYRSTARSRRKFATIGLAFAAIAVVMFITEPAHAQRRLSSPFHVGQKVEFDWAGDTVQGEVVSIDRFSGWVAVRCVLAGHTTSLNFPADQVRPVKKTVPAKPAAGRELREWTDVSGDFKLKARFVKLAGAKVTLEKEDGTSVAVPLRKLSEADQKLAQELATGGSEKSANAENSTDAVGDAPEGDWSHVRTVTVITSADGAIPADAAAWEKFTAPRPTTLRTPPENDGRSYFFEEVCGMFLNRPRRLLIVATMNNAPGKKKPGARLECCDLKTAKSLGVEILGTPKTPIDLSPDGTCVICAPDRTMSFGRDTGIPRGVEIWRLAKGGSLVKRWIADEGQNTSDRSQSDLAYFISDAQVLTVNTWTGAATLWNVADASAVYTLKISGRPAFSANRKQMAIMADRRICILDTATGNTLAALPGTPEAFSTLAFRADGTQLAVCTSQELQVWDLANKKLAAEVWFPTAEHVWDRHVDWIDDRRILLDKSTLIDAGLQLVLWKYKAPATAKMSGSVFDGTLSYLNTRKIPLGRNLRAARAARKNGADTESEVCFAALPDAEALRIADSLKPELVTALGPGGHVSLDLQGGVNGDDLQKLTAELEEQLTKKGIGVAPGSPISLRATIENGKTDTKTYHRIGGNEQQTVTTTERVFRLAFVENGNVLWETTSSTGSGPSFLQAEQGESAQQALDKVQAKSPFGFFMRAKVPNRIVRYGEEGCFGSSELTPAGPTP